MENSVGLNNLLNLSKVTIKRHFANGVNTYSMWDDQNVQCFVATEQSNSASGERILHIFDQTKIEIIRFSVHIYCCKGTCCCESEIHRKLFCYFLPDRSSSTVKLEYSHCKPYFYIVDANNEKVLELTGSRKWWQCVCCDSDVSYPIFVSGGGLEIGRAIRRWSGFETESFTYAQKYDLEFPKDLDAKMKAALIGAVFFIHFNFFETRPGMHD